MYDNVKAAYLRLYFYWYRRKQIVKEKKEQFRSYRDKARLWCKNCCKKKEVKKVPVKEPEVKTELEDNSVEAQPKK